jgi:DNA modification methylase
LATDRRNSVPIGSSLSVELKKKGRRRREDLERIRHSASTTLLARNDLLPRLEITFVRLADVRPAQRKLRKLDTVHAWEIAASIGALGFNVPVLLGQDNAVIDGEARIEAARLMGLDRVPCIRVDHLSPKEQRVLRLAVNRLGEKGQWDLDELKVEFEELIIDDAPIEITGFAFDEVDQILLGDEANSLEEGPLAPQEAPTAVSRIGDIFQLGPHRLICGDASEPAVPRRLMQDDPPARLVLTDEPYNVPIVCNVTGGAHREFAMASGEMTDEQFLAFNIAWIEASLVYLCDGGIFGTFIDWRGYLTVQTAAVRLGLHPLNLIVWSKNNAGMGSLYRSQHELLPLFKKGRAPHVNNVNLGRHGRWRSNVWTYPGASSFGSDARRGLQDHPTVKPTAMLADGLLDLTNRGDIVMDSFLGSGSTLIAAEKTGRVCRGAELDPLYVDVIVRRYQSATGHGAVLVETGECFDNLAQRRARELGELSN